MNKGGRPQNQKHICSCCQQEFSDATKKAKHEYNKRKTMIRHQSVATPSLAGEKLKERMKDFQMLEKQTLGGLNSAFKQPTSIIKPQARLGTEIKQTINQNAFTNALTNGIKSCPGQPLMQTQNKYKISSNVNTEEDLGFQYNSDEDIAGVDATPSISNTKVQGFLNYNAANAKDADIPKVSSSSTTKKKTTTGSTTTAFEELKLTLQQYRQWGEAEGTIQGCLFNTMPLTLDEHYAQCFLVQAAELEDRCQQHEHELFVPALAQVIKSVNLSKMSLIVLNRFTSFLSQYQVLDCHSDADLHQLFMLAETIKGPINWVAEATSKVVVVTQDSLVSSYITYIEVVRLFMSFHKHYSWPYIAYMRSELTNLGLLRLLNTECFLKLMNYENVEVTPTDWLRLSKQFYQIKGGDLTQIATAGEMILQEFSLNASVLLGYIEVGLKGGIRVLMKQLKQGKDPRSIEQLIGLQKLQIEEEKLQIQDQKAKNAKTRLEVAVKLGQALKIEKEKIQSTKNKKLEEKLYTKKLMQVYKAFCELNKMEVNEQGLLDFAQAINKVASQLPIPLQTRPDQAASIHILLNSQYKRTLMQLPTGTGKSLMFGLMARYLNLMQGVKVAVVVPNEVLAAIQQDKYCPQASRVQDDLFRKEVKEIFYCTYDDFLTGDVPQDTVILVDEIDALFFNDKPQLKGTKFLSAILLLNKYKVIGMTATFRGDQGRNKILQFIEDSYAIKTTDIVLERNLQLDVFGKLKPDQVNAKMIEVTKFKQRELPVIIILPSIKKCEEIEQHFEQCYIFGKGRVFDQLGVLKLIQAEQNPFPVILTTAEVSLGQDFTAIAYVIQTQIPDSYSTFVQNAGRSNRIDPSAALIGALIITNPILDIESVKQGCEFEQQRQKLFKEDYLESLKLLEQCVPTTEPQIKALKSAVAALNEKRDRSEIVNILCKTNFKNITQQSPKKRDAKAQDKQFGLLAKQTKLPSVFTSGLALSPSQDKRNVKEDQNQDSYSACSSSNESQFLKSKKQEANVTLGGLGSFVSGSNAFVPSAAMATAANNQEELKTGDDILPLEHVATKNQQQEHILGKRTSSKDLRQLEREPMVDIVSQFVDKNSFVEFSATAVHRKRESKVVIKSSVAPSEVSRSSSGRFEAKYKVGDKTASGAIIKDVTEKDWLFVERDTNGNSYYKCLKCQKAPRVRKGNRKTHSC